MLLGFPTALHGLISTILWASSPDTRSTQPTPLTFQLRHQHAVTSTSRVIFNDVSPQASFLGEATEFSIPTRKKRIPRPRSQTEFHAARRNPQRDFTPALDWDDWDVASPDLSKRSTVLQLAKMNFNSYSADNSTGEWYDVSDSWSNTPFGWEPEADGMRGHIFVTPDNSTVVISIKGTSAGWITGGGGPTVGKDKKNDNLLFSCCCARVGRTWSPVCDCYDGNYRCDSQCVEDALVDEGLYYPTGLNLYNNISYMYPNGNIWLTGHSLGGGLSALIGATFGAPVVAFEAPAERMASRRLHLPSPPSTHHITHIYHNADPIPMGVCTGPTSLCSIGGFALESKCHLGEVILYDAVGQLGWSVDVRNHPIKVVIDKLLSDESLYRVDGAVDEGRESQGLLSFLGWPWKRHGDKKEGDSDGDDSDPVPEVPAPRPAHEVEGEDGVCTDCFNWEFGAFKNRTQPGKARLNNIKLSP